MSESLKFVPCIPAGTGATGPVSEFGQHNFVVLRKIFENPGTNVGLSPRERGNRRQAIDDKTGEVS